MSDRIIVHRRRQILHLGVDFAQSPWIAHLIRSLPTYTRNFVPGATDAQAAALRLLRPAFPDLDRRAGLGRLQRIARAMRGYDMVLTHGEGALRAVLAHSFFSTTQELPPLAHFHDELQPAKTGMFGNLRHRLAFARTSAIIVPCTATAASAAKAWELSGARLHIIAPVCPAPPKKPPNVPRLVKRKDERWIGVAADALEDEGRAVLDALKTMGEGWRLVVFGPEEQTAPVRREAVAREIGDRLLTSDRYASVGPVAGLLDIALLRGEKKLPAALPEVMAAGVAFAVMGPPEIAALLPGEAAPFCVPDGAFGLLGTATETLAGDAQLRERLGNAGRSLAARRDSSAHQQLFADLLGEKQFA